MLIGPNNSGKTTALQALALWDIGVRRWNESCGGRPHRRNAPGVTINRRDLISIPVPDANLFWRDLHVQRGAGGSGRKKKPKTAIVRIDVIVDGITNDRQWSCGIEFDYANEESFYCRPLRTGGDNSSGAHGGSRGGGGRAGCLPAALVGSGCRRAEVGSPGDQCPDR